MGSEKRMFETVTTDSLLAEVARRCAERAQVNQRNPHEAGREFALARKAAEDARMRFARGVAREGM